MGNCQMQSKEAEHESARLPFLETAAVQLGKVSLGRLTKATSTFTFPPHASPSTSTSSTRLALLRLSLNIHSTPLSTSMTVIGILCA